MGVAQSKVGVALWESAPNLVQSKPTNIWYKKFNKSKDLTTYSNSMSRCDEIGASLDCLV